MDFQRQFARRRLLVLMDAASIVVSMVLAGVAHSSLRRHFFVFKDPPGLEQYLLVAVLTMPLMLGMAVALGLHRQFERPFNGWRALANHGKLHLATLLGIALIVFLTQAPLNRSVVGLFLMFTFVLMFGSRLLLNRWLKRRYASRQGRHHLLVIGSDAALVELVVDSARAEDLPPEFVGILDAGNALPQANVAYVPVIGGIEALSRVLHEVTVDEVILATGQLTSTQFENILEACDELGTPMRQLVLPQFHDGRRLGLERQYGLPFVTLARTERTIETLAVKRAIDLIGSATAIVLFSPVILMVTACILTTMGRPVLFSQERIGYHGRRFLMHKFRSMVNDAEKQRDALNGMNEMKGPVFKIARDPRITPLGRFLRKYSLDELPQLINVFSGTMSLVGPRPLPVAEQQQISGPMRRRLSMKPGCTGLWQVSGRSNLSFEEWMKMDLEYIDNYSPWLDIQLLARTIPAVIAGRGAS